MQILLGTRKYKEEPRKIRKFKLIQTELKALKSRMNNAEEWLSDLEDRIIKITQSGQQTENQMKKHESNIRNPWDNIKQANLCIIGICNKGNKRKARR